VRCLASRPRLLREAAARKWFLALGAATTLALVLVGAALRLEVVDGALAATRLGAQPSLPDRNELRAFLAEPPAQ